MSNNLTNKQREVIARRMGYNGPMSKFHEFLMSSPDVARMKSGGMVIDSTTHQTADGTIWHWDGKQFVKIGTADTSNTTNTAPTKSTTSTTTPNDTFQQSVQQYTAPTSTLPDTNVKTQTITDAQRDAGMINTQSGQLTGPTPEAHLTTVDHTATAATPNQVLAATYDAAQVGDSVENVINQYQYAQGTVAPESTVQGQLSNLMQDFEEGTPAWAAGALRAADTQMAQRGLGASSMAGAATTQAAMEAALPIAAADAQAHLTMQLTNLNNKQQMLVQANAARTEALFTDIAAQNAARQFNASSENQVRQFNASLKAQVDQFNASQINAMAQFNAGEANAMSMFQTNLENQRQQFNATNRLIVDQANAQWRQQVTTMNNATINEANRIDASMAFQGSLAQYNNEFQARRDAYAFAYSQFQNEQDRALQLLLAQMSIDEAKRQEKSTSSTSLWSALGALTAQIVDGIF